ncbi:glycine--tRNA ligase subunit beta [Sulfurihydrogenibium sp.]|jgi:glycyl-tRNA synthetase beta chain|uniref:glycine--tRNA ligase subunit beta n=1 Tax=Sulfurihydrogenibium sp. TaxID=2053621 RepID=UPI00260CF1D9|nr:glycine--tRNA ligase subunit beta [Sulfurihydrogenibium sp.]
MKSYLLEIGCEELPPKAILTYKEFLKEYAHQTFKDFFIYESPENIKIYATPRRLAVLIKNLKEKQDNQKITLIGPPYKVAVDSEGRFTKAALSFAEKNNIPLEKLEKITTEKGEYLGATIEKEGESLESFIKHKIPQLFNQFPQLKSMKWNNSDYRFPRPIRWIVSLLDDKVIEFEVASVKADRFTYLHRFMTKPIGRGERKDINHANDYEEITKLGYIIANFEDRKHSIKTQYEGFARQLNANIIEDDELIDEITCLTEFPVGIVGDFSPEYLILPKEVIITVCKHHQRYLNFEKDGKLIPKFLAFSNNAVKDRDIVKNGYEKVLRARLEDALFFYKEDLKKKLDDNIEKLKGIQFHEKLGSMYDKVLRSLKLALKLADLIGYKDTEKIKRAVMLSKADLLTEMVKEFDELQGIMGMYYSQKQGEEEEISKSIYEHYLPKTAEDNIPETNLGTLLALADKLDTVISFIKIGELPKPSADPFGIRRNAIGIVRLLVEKEIDLDLRKIIDDESILEFIFSRLESYLQSKGYKTDIINAVLSLKDGNIYRNYLKVKALSQLRNLPDYENVIMVFKRVGNIIPEDFKFSNVDVNLLASEPEKELYKKFIEIKDKFKQFIENKDYDKALGLMLELKPYIDRFFDNVMIMVEDEKLKNNRLNLLKEINDLFRNIADFTKLIGG